MSEESKTPDGDYVQMGDGPGVKAGGAPLVAGLDDPNLSQEDRDHRLAIALQQQENSAVYEAHVKKHQQAKAAQEIRTARSGTFSKLAAVRDKDHGMLSVPASYSTENAYVSGEGGEGEYSAPIKHTINHKEMLPQEIADANLAAELQKVEQASAGTAQTLGKIVNEDKEDDEAQKHRTERSTWRH